MTQPQNPNPSQSQGPQQLSNPSSQPGSPQPASGHSAATAQQLRQLKPNQPPPAAAQAQSVGRIPGVFAVKAEHLAAKEELKNRLAHVVTAQAATRGASDPNIVGIGVGLRFVEGRPFPELVLKVFVAKKFAPSKVPGGAMVPESVNGVPTDVHEFGRIRAQAFGRIPRPVQCGCEIGPAGGGESGTLGCLVVANDQLFILSNNHVMAKVNHFPGGTHILQPGAVSQGQDPADLIGVLDGGYPRIDFTPGADNRVDAALALTSWSDDFNLVDPTFVGGVVMSEDSVQAAVGMNVHKIGMRTDHTSGQVIGAHVDNMPVDYGQDGGTANYNDMVVVTGQGGLFSAPGDSGSVIMTTGTNQPIALLVAGGSGGTVACNIGNVAAALGITRFVGSKP
jgi:hypothetical protein